MRLEPPNLNVPLEKAERRVFPLLLAGLLLCILTAWLQPAWGITLSAAYLVGLPVLFLLLRPGVAQRILRQQGDLGRIAYYLLLLGYLALAKQFLVPGLVALLDAWFLS